MTPSRLATLFSVLDRIPVSTLAEYLCRRLELDDGDLELQLRFHNGRYDRAMVWDGDRRRRRRLGAT